MNNGLLEAILAEVTKNWDHITLNDVVRAIGYFKRFGYLARTDSLTITDIKDAVYKFQRLFGLTEDGEIGPKVLAAINLPRCGCPEHFTTEAREQLTKWGTNDLTYFIESRDTDLSKEVWDSTMQKAFDQISEVCNLNFKQITNRATANIIVGTGRGRNNQFDGSSGTLAWAELPRNTLYKGQLQMKFDLDEIWVLQGRGIRLLNVACHEFGHIAGLTHSQVKTALLAPFYSESVSKPQQNDDIPRLVSLYGKPKQTPDPIPEPDPEPDPNPSILNISIKGNIENITIPGYRIYKAN